jgi:hypothetical protein
MLELDPTLKLAVLDNKKATYFLKEKLLGPIFQLLKAKSTKK